MTTRFATIITSDNYRFKLIIFGFDQPRTASINGSSYPGWIGVITQLDLTLALLDSPLGWLKFSVSAPENSDGPASGRIYAFDPSGNGSQYALYADGIQAQTGSFELALSDRLKISFNGISLGFSPLSTYPNQSQLKANISVDEISLSQTTDTGSEILFEAGSGSEKALNVQLDLNAKEAGDLALELHGLRLGKALIGADTDLKGSVALLYSASQGSLSLSGEVGMAGLSGQLAASFDMGNNTLKSLSFGLKSDSVLSWGDSLSFMPGEFLFTYEPSASANNQSKSTFHLASKGSKLQLGSTTIAVYGDVYASLRADETGITEFQLDRGKLQLAETLRLPLGALMLEVGKGSSLEISRDGLGQPSVALSGSATLSGLGNGLDGLGFSISATNPVVWSDGQIKFNGRLDLPTINAGPIVIGPDAHISLSGDRLSIDPDLKVNAALFALTLKPLAEPINSLLMPIVKPIVDLVDDPIPLPNGLGNTLEPQWWWTPPQRSARQALDGSIKDFRKGLITLMESSPGRIDTWKGDGQLEMVDVIDFGLYLLWKLAQASGPSTAQLSSMLGIDASVLEILRGATQPQFANTLDLLNRIGQFAKLIQSADITQESNLVDLPDLKLELSINDLSNLGALIGLAQKNGKNDIEQTASKSLLANLLQTSDALKQLGQANADSQEDPGSFAIQARGLFNLPIFDDWTATFAALSKGKPFDLVNLGISTDVRAQLSYNQIINLMPLIGIPLPLSVGFSFQLGMQLNALLGLTTTGSTLSQLADSISTRLGSIDGLQSVGSQLAGLVSEVTSELFFPTENGKPQDGMGLYLSHPANAPLLSVNPELRFQAGVDYGWIGARAYAGLGANLDLSLKAKSGTNGPGKLYFNSIYNTISRLFNDPTSVSLDNLTNIFDYNFNAYLPWGVDPRLPILGWIPNLPYLTGKLPLLSVNSSSKARALAGPAEHASVHLDLRHFDHGKLIASGDLVANDNEPATTTDDTGGYHLEPPADLSTIGNNDGLLDYRDGMVLVGTPDVEMGSIQLHDSITGLDLGMPLVGLPAPDHEVNATILTTLKYAELLRWSPDQTILIAGEEQPLSPDLINRLLPQMIVVPKGIEDDHFNPYRALRAGGDQRQQALDTLRFSYQQLFVVRTIEELLQHLQLDYSDPELWGLKGRQLDPKGVDQPAITAYSAFSTSLLNLCGTSPQPWRIAPLGSGDRFDLSRADHLKLMLEEILADYPTKALVGDGANRDLFGHANWAPGTPEHHLADQTQAEFVSDNTKLRSLIQSQFGSALQQLSGGLAALVQHFGEQFDQAAKLSEHLGQGNSDLLIPAIAGIKRQTFNSLIPDLISQSLDPKVDDSTFNTWIQQSLDAPMLVDARDRQPDYQLRLDQAQLSGYLARFKVHLCQRNDPTQAAHAPDYGLSLRYRLGGSAKEGLDYVVLDQGPIPLLQVEPGNSEATLTLKLNPASLRTAAPLTIQLDLLGADSGIAIDPGTSVAGVSMGQTPQAQPIQPRSAFSPPTTTITGVRGQVDHLQLPTSIPYQDLVQVSNFDPDEGDILEVDPVSIAMLRRRTFVPSQDLAATPTALDQAWEQYCKLNDSDLVVVAGVLLDRPSQTPLALVSTTADNGSDVAWSQISGGSQLRFTQANNTPIPGAILLGDSAWIAGSSMLLSLADRSKQPWQGATSLDLCLAGSAATPLISWPGRPQADPLGFSRAPELPLQLGTVGQSGEATLELHQLNGPGSITLQVVAQTHGEAMQLLLPDGRLWGALQQAGQGSIDQAPELTYKALDGGGNGGGASRSLQLGACSRSEHAVGAIHYEASSDGGLHWQATGTEQRDLAPGTHWFRAQEQQADGHYLLSNPIQIVVAADGSWPDQPNGDLAATGFMGRAASSDPSETFIASWTIAQDRLTGIRLDRLGGDQPGATRQLTVGLELLREAAYASELSFCLMDTRTGSLVDPISGQSLAGWGDRQGWRSTVGLSGLGRFVAQEGTPVQDSFRMTIGATVDLSSCALVPVLQVPDHQASTFGGAARLNADGLNHLASLGPNCLGFEDLAGGGDNDFNDVIMRITRLGVSQA